MCNPNVMFLNDPGDIAANKLARLLRDNLSHAFGAGAPTGYATYRVRRFIHENWAELSKLAHEVHASPRIIGEWPEWRPNFEPDMPDYAVSG